MKKIVGLSAFNGIGCCHLALERAGVVIGPGDFYTSEILEDAKRISKFHYPNDIELDDICNIDGYQFRGLVNFFAGGSPCQSFSNAGTREGFDGKSKLFFEWHRLKKEIRPDYWILENVWMKKEWQRIISDLLGVEPIFINSKVGTSQNRPRLYWTNIPYTPIEDKGILLGDDIMGAVTGAGKHGKAIPEHLKIPGGFNWKNRGWEFNPNNKAYCVTTCGGSYKNIQGDVKRFTAENCEALQRIPIGYTGVTGLCDTKRIELIGNAWTIDILAEAFFKNLPWASEKKMSLRLKYLNK